MKVAVFPMREGKVAKEARMESVIESYRWLLDGVLSALLEQGPNEEPQQVDWLLSVVGLHEGTDEAVSDFVAHHSDATIYAPGQGDPIDCGFSARVLGIASDEQTKRLLQP